jgi:exosortase A
LIRLWNQLQIGEYSHGYLVVAISLYLILRQRRTLSTLTPCPNTWALLAVAAASLLWMLAALADVQMLQTVGLLLVVLAVVWTVVGNRVTRALLFPILFIGFAIPVWFPLSPLLQDLTADAVFGTIRLLGIPALRQENLIVLPAGRLSIEEACSGLRYLLAALTLGTLYAYLNYKTFRARLIIVLISVGAAVLSNMLRVFIVVYLGYTTDMQHPLVHDHLSLGWYLFGGLVVILLFLDARLHRQHNTMKYGLLLAEKGRCSTWWL